ncbi:MAG: (4Fe-4S)-binding protein, partial [Chloroflexi bacterium]|nr:(4Fe-4S)-binding protein [Chloroflexota bacterium]
VETVKKLNIPRGVVINRAGVGDRKVDEYCVKEGIPVLLTIPLDTQIASYYSRGIPLVEGVPQWGERFQELFAKVREKVDNHG